MRVSLVTTKQNKLALRIVFAELGDEGFFDFICLIQRPQANVYI